MVRTVLSLLIVSSMAIASDQAFVESMVNERQQAMDAGVSALSPNFIDELINDARATIKADAEQTVGTEHEAKPVDRVTHKILISDAMGQRELQALLRDLAHRDDVAFVLRGLLPEEKTINDVGMRIINLIKEFEQVPYVSLDPRPFQKVGAEYAPQILTYYDDELVLSATGLTNPNYMEEAWEQGKSGNLGKFGDVVKISERDITEVLKERMDKLDKKQLIENAKNNYWEKVQFLELPDAQELRVREFEPVLQLSGNILDGHGNVIAFAGDTYNTLHYKPFTMRLVVFDATDIEQLEYVKSLPESPLRTKFITTQFDRTLKWDAVKAVESELNAQVWQLNADIVNAFNVQVVPTIVTADNERNVFVIEEGMVR